MNPIEEIEDFEERLRQAELGPDPHVFESLLADGPILDGLRNKARIVAAHQPGEGPKFTRVDMSDFEFVDHGFAVVVTCKGAFHGPQWSGALKFMRVWLKKDGRWQIIAASVANA